MSEHETLVLQPDHPCNTTLVDQETGKVAYIVFTEHTEKTSFTKIQNADGDTLASSEWRDVRSDLLTLGSAPPVASSVWLRKSKVPFKDTVEFDDVAGKKYKWKGNGPGLSFELYSSEDKLNPLARYSKSRRVLNHSTTPPTPEMRPATLVFDKRGSEIRDLVVISFLFLEKSRRARENSTMNRADVLGSPLAPIGGNKYLVNNGGV